MAEMFIFLDYLSWHYTIALVAIFDIQKNYVIGTWHQFLISQHLRTLFAPWHRRQPSDFGKKASTISSKVLDAIADFYIRILAAFVRLAIIASGFVWIAVIYVVFFLTFIIWLFWPLIFVLFLIRGVTLIF